MGNLARVPALRYYRHSWEKLEARSRNSSAPQKPKVAVVNTECAAQENYEISPRFRSMIEERIARLEQDAARDEADVARLDDVDHICRQLRLVAVERAEALRMRLFLDRARTRPRTIFDI
jgi:hypothetical protein